MFSGLHNFCTILYILPNFAHLTQLGTYSTFMHYFIYSALFFFKFCKNLHIFHKILHVLHLLYIFTKIAHFAQIYIFHNFAYLAKFCMKDLLIVHNCSNWLNEWPRNYFLIMVEFSKKIGQGGAKSGQYLHQYILQVFGFTGCMFYR